MSLLALWYLGRRSSQWTWSGSWSIGQGRGLAGRSSSLKGKPRNSLWLAVLWRGSARWSTQLSDHSYLHRLLVACFSQTIRKKSHQINRQFQLSPIHLWFQFFQTWPILELFLIFKPFFWRRSLPVSIFLLSRTRPCTDSPNWRHSAARMYQLLIRSSRHL